MVLLLDLAESANYVSDLNELNRSGLSGFSLSKKDIGWIQNLIGLIDFILA